MELKKTEKRWIGIDGGGSKTSCVIGDKQGQILSYAIGASSNIHAISPQNVYHTLTQLINKVIDESKSTIHQIESIQLCLAGADRECDQKVIRALFKDTLYEQKIKIRNDAEAALASGTWGQSGILLIAGTGSIVYVICNETNERMRVGGWGYLLGDEGSGFYIGQRALRAILKAYDCRGQKTVLTNLVLDHFKLQQVPELLKLYSVGNYVPEVARISQFVLQAARREDPVALEIMQDAVYELIQMVKVAYHHSVYKELTLVLHGGLFSDAYFKSIFLENLETVIGDVKIAQPELPAVIGAYLLAVKESGLIIDDKFKKNINFSWNKFNHQ